MAIFTPPGGPDPLPGGSGGPGGEGVPGIPEVRGSEAGVGISCGKIVEGAARATHWSLTTSGNVHVITRETRAQQQHM